MRYILSFLMLLAFACPIQAVDVSSMTPAQRQELKNQLEQAEKPTAVVVREEAEKWSQLGISVGQAVVGAAKEIGVAAGDFSQTPLGKVIVATVVIKVFGNTVIHIVTSVVILIMVSTFFWYVHRRILQIPKYEVRPVLWGMWNCKFLVGYVHNDSSNQDAWNITSTIVLVVGILISTASFLTAF